MARKGLGKGLDSLIPNFYDEDFDSNSPQSLEDILNDANESDKNDEVESIVENEVQVEENISEDETEETVEEVTEVEENVQEDSKTSIGEEEVPEEEELPDEDNGSESLYNSESGQETVQNSQEIQIQQEHVEEVKAIVEKNPRITLWSSRSSAVFRYLRKTEPEFSISKEASILIDEAVSKKYPEIWKLFED